MDYWIYENRPNIVYRELLMQVYAWGFFLVNEFIMLIVLFNFVIAVISESYEKVMSTQTIDVFRMRAKINSQQNLETLE